LFDTYSSTNKFDRPVILDIIEEIKFEELPHTAANCVTYGAALLMQTSYETEGAKMQVYSSKFEMALISLKREHYRNRNMVAPYNAQLNALTGSSGVSSRAVFIGGRSR
jgi:hypothetical protein